MKIIRQNCGRMLSVFALVVRFIFDVQPVPAQSTAFVFKSGLSMGMQRWDDNFDRQPLFKYHGALSIESVNNDDDRLSFLVQMGYHLRGSANRLRLLFTTGGAQVFREEFIFNNLALIVGAKIKKSLFEKSRYFYFGGLRGEYTWMTNLDDLVQPNPQLYIFYPTEGGVQRLLGGLSLGGGVEFDVRELVGFQIELSMHPDLTLQYQQPPIGNIIDPFNPGQVISIPERRIRNTTFELSLGIRLLRKVIYEKSSVW